MFGNGSAMVVAAIILSLALLFADDVGGGGGMSEEDLAVWQARALGDIRNDVVVNCGCCDGKSERRAAGSF